MSIELLAPAGNLEKLFTEQTLFTLQVNVLGYEPEPGIFLLRI